jgi:hypothetical protein
MRRKGCGRWKEKPRDETEISEIEAAPISKELKKRWSYFIRKVCISQMPGRDAHHQLLMSLKNFLPPMPGKLPIRG